MIPILGQFAVLYDYCSKGIVATGNTDGWDHCDYGNDIGCSHPLGSHCNADSVSGCIIPSSVLGTDVELDIREQRRLTILGVIRGFLGSIQKSCEGLPLQNPT